MLRLFQVSFLCLFLILPSYPALLYGGEDIITETGVQMVSETGSQDLITEQAP